ncbi:hypothetical protein BJ138DRAFT_1117635, partial [Hygrophoropsis aurantiaca]
YDWRAPEPDHDPGNIDIEIDTPSEPAAFWDIFGALWSKYPKAYDLDAPLRHGVVSEVGIGVDYQRFILAGPPPPHAQLEEADTAHDVLEDLNNKIIADAGTISALQRAIEYLSRRQDEDRRQSHDDLTAKQVIIDSMAEQMADKDLAMMGLHQKAHATILRHEEVLSTMRDEASAKQRKIDELKGELDESVEERAQQQTELVALRREVAQLKDANSELTLMNSTLKADLDKLSDAVVQMFPGSDDEDNDDDDNDDNDDNDLQDRPSTPPPAPQMVSRIPRWTPRKKPLLTTASQFTRVIKPDATLTPATMQLDAVASSFLPTSTTTPKFKTRPVVFLNDAPRRRLPFKQKILHSPVTSTSTIKSTRTSTTVSPNKAAKKISARKPF